MQLPTTTMSHKRSNKKWRQFSCLHYVFCAEKVWNNCAVLSSCCKECGVKTKQKMPPWKKESWRQRLSHFSPGVCILWCPKKRRRITLVVWKFFKALPANIFGKKHQEKKKKNSFISQTTNNRPPHITHKMEGEMGKKGKKRCSLNLKGNTILWCVD